MKILVIGGGGREHAIIRKLKESPKVDKIYCAPGNGGISKDAECVGISAMDLDGAVAFAKDNQIDLVFVAPDDPLAAGMVDRFEAAGIPAFGPNAAAAQIESSKVFSKNLMKKYHIPTARYEVFSDPKEAVAYIEKNNQFPIVVKADGLALGKGVVVAATVEEAEEAVRSMMQDHKFGASGSTVVIEECLTGPECSMLAFVSDGKAHCMATAQDHKRAFDGDRGPNTGGMGVYSPVPIVTPDELAAMHDIMERAAVATAREFDNDYRGVLYGGFMLTPEGPKIIEFNARFGDPETQVVLPRLESDLADIMLAVAEGRPDDIDLRWSEQWAVCVVLASEGYPGSYEKGKVILGIDEAEQIEGVTVFHAGTAKNFDDELVTAGGRVLNVVALGDSFDDAREKAYEACDLINFEGKQYRSDIGKRAAAGRAAWEN